MKVQIGNQTIEVPQGVEVKIIDEEKHKFVPGQYIACNGAVYRITNLTDRGYAVKEVRAPKDADEWETIELGFINEPKMELLPDYEEIIDEWGDAHDRYSAVKSMTRGTKTARGSALSSAPSMLATLTKSPTTMHFSTRSGKTPRNTDMGWKTMNGRTTTKWLSNICRGSGISSRTTISTISLTIAIWSVSSTFCTIRTCPYSKISLARDLQYSIV